MFNKIYENMIKFIKDYWLFLVIDLLLAFIFLFPLPYVVDVPGGAIKVSDNYEIANSYKEVGSFNLTYVSSTRGTPFNLLISLFSNKRDVHKMSDEVLDNETYDNMLTRGLYDFKESNNVAEIIALEKSGHEVVITKRNLVVTYIDKKAKTDLKLEDQIIKINGEVVDSVEKIKELVNKEDKSLDYKVTYLRDNVEHEGYFKTYYDQESKSYKVGIIINYVTEFTSDVDIKTNSNKDLYGPSAGLMNTLQIYNLLTETDYTGGKKISGTGTIELDGSVGAIGGIKYKLLGAEKKKCDIFLVPSDNYEEALKVKKKYHLKIKLIKVNNIDDALEELEKLL